MQVLIVSKTHFDSLACVGAIEMESKKSIRLHNTTNSYQPGNTEFEIGQIWNMEFNRQPDAPPHIEDAVIQNKRLERNIENIDSYIRENCVIWSGSPQVLFNGSVKWTSNGSGYVNSQDIPENSVGFWISDKDLTFENSYYIYPRVNIFRPRKRLSYKGYTEAIEIIPAGTLIRVSLAKWWKQKEIDIEKRCYLQLSGWY